MLYYVKKINFNRLSAHGLIRRNAYSNNSNNDQQIFWKKMVALIEIPKWNSKLENGQIRIFISIYHNSHRDKMSNHDDWNFD